MCLIRRAKNGCGGDVTFLGIPVYQIYSAGFRQSILGSKLDKKLWINDNVNEKKYISCVTSLLIDWELYENGWLVNPNKHKHLFYYRCQIGINSRPNQLDHLK
jgi:hypothetical protein